MIYDEQCQGQYKGCITNISLRCEEIEASDGNHGVGHTMWYLVHYSTLRALPACAERREPAMCVYESYMSHMGIRTQLN
jgi:hypothetical protein